MKKTLICSLSTLLLLSGCGVNVKINDTSKNNTETTTEGQTNPFLEAENTTIVEETVEPTQEPTPATTTVEYADMKITVKDGWTYSKEFMSSDFISFEKKAVIQVPVIKVYKGDANDSNPYVVFSSFDPMEGLGGLYEYKRDIGEVSIGNFTYRVYYNNYAPYNVLFSQTKSEDWYEYYTPITTSNGTKRYIHVSYFDHGTSDYDDFDVMDMIASLEITNKIGEIEVTADNLNVRNDANKDATKLWLTHKGSKFDVYETRNDGGYTWYRIGAYSWVADQNGEWVNYSQY